MLLSATTPRIREETEGFSGRISAVDLVARLISQRLAHVLSPCLTLLQAHLPFAVVGSTEEVKVGNKLVRARQYPWGVVQGKVLGAGHTAANLPAMCTGTRWQPPALPFLVCEGALC